MVFHDNRSHFFKVHPSQKSQKKIPGFPSLGSLGDKAAPVSASATPWQTDQDRNRPRRQCWRLGPRAAGWTMRCSCSKSMASFRRSSSGAIFFCSNSWAVSCCDLTGTSFHQNANHLPTLNPKIPQVGFGVRLMIFISAHPSIPDHSSAGETQRPQVSLGRRILTTDVAIISLTTLAADALAEAAEAAPRTPWSAWLVSKLCS